MLNEADDAYERRLEEKLKAVMAEHGAATEAELEGIEQKLLEVEVELEGAKKKRKNGDALFDAEFEQRLGEFHGKVDKMKESRQAQERVTQREQVQNRDSARGLGIGLSIAYTIIGMPLAGAGLGWLLDRALGTQTYVGIGVIVFGALGMFVALFVLGRNNDK
ncbi:MAG: hypothetical protein ACAH95_16515 [Fimbriimonas sp.]